MSWTKTNRPAPLEIWGGVECSVVRTACGLYDQLERTGHGHRMDDLDRFAALGLRTLRYPVLWERHAADPIGWTWTDRRMERLRALGIKPIIGLLHHGCGPLPGGFYHPGFVEGLAKFARAVAERYPWVDAYTPINEPLTTARFSGLYGLWDPFGRDPAAFAKIFLVQCQAIRAAMAAIREINPRARLVQTEDVGKTHATPALAYQADWENERRWLTFDLLGGKLDARYPLWHYLLQSGVSEDELASFRAEPCEPDLLGMNHYVTGERWLDHRVENYPAEYCGGNGRHTYADVPAVRARPEGIDGPAALLRELWERFRQPIAITEVQLACTRDEQLRWLAEIWQGAQLARNQGVDVRAVTAWALLGAFDWDSLLLSNRGRYESGAFDVSGAEPRKTAVGWAVQRIVSGGGFYHPVLAVPGWWRRPCRLLFPASASATDCADQDFPRRDFRRPLLIVGPHEGVSAVLRGLAEARGVETVTVHHGTINDYAACCELLNRHLPWAAVVFYPRNGSDQAGEPHGWSAWYERCRAAFESLCQRRRVACESLAVERDAGASLTPDLHRLLDRLIDQSFALDHFDYETLPEEVAMGK